MFLQLTRWNQRVIFLWTWYLLHLHLHLGHFSFSEAHGDGGKLWSFWFKRKEKFCLCCCNTDFDKSSDLLVFSVVIHCLHLPVEGKTIFNFRAQIAVAITGMYCVHWHLFSSWTKIRDTQSISNFVGLIRDVGLIREDKTVISLLVTKQLWKTSFIFFYTHPPT